MVYRCDVASRRRNRIYFFLFLRRRVASRDLASICELSFIDVAYSNHMLEVRTGGIDYNAALIILQLPVFGHGNYMLPKGLSQRRHHARAR